jgi:hypothetical protein
LRDQLTCTPFVGPRKAFFKLVSGVGSSLVSGLPCSWF